MTLPQSPATYPQPSYRHRDQPQRLCQLSLQQAFHVLLDAYHGFLDPNIPLRNSSTNIDPASPCFFVINPKTFSPAVLHKLSSTPRTNHGLNVVNFAERVLDHLTREKSFGSASSSEETCITVEFETFGSSRCDIYWASTGQLLGVIARPMVRKRQGLSGRVFTLIHQSNNKQVSPVPGVPDLVQVWSNSVSNYNNMNNAYDYNMGLDALNCLDENPSSTRKYNNDNSIPGSPTGTTASSSLYSSNNTSNGYAGNKRDWRDQEGSNYSDPAHIGMEKLDRLTAIEDLDSLFSSDDETEVVKPSSSRSDRIEKDVVINGDLIVSAETTTRNLHIKGNLLVEGTISGQLVTPTGAADYAEWFAMLSPDSEQIEPGMVVQLRSPQQKITLDTSHQGPHLVVSTSPSVAAGIPPTRVPGALCAFIGQVPVKVHGPVKTGDLLFPSGLNDGYAISEDRHCLAKRVASTRFKYQDRTTAIVNENEPLGTSMLSCGEGKHTILAFVRWQHSLRHQILQVHEKNLQSIKNTLWAFCFLSLFDDILEMSFYWTHEGFVAEKFLALTDLTLNVYSFWNFPNYLMFVRRGDVLVYLALKFVRFLNSMYTIAMYMGPSEANNEGQFHMKAMFVSFLCLFASTLSVFGIISFLSSYLAASSSDMSEVHPVIAAAYNKLSDVTEMFPNSWSKKSKRKLQ